jgi:hypothetical protein
MHFYLEAKPEIEYIAKHVFGKENMLPIPEDGSKLNSSKHRVYHDRQCPT